MQTGKVTCESGVSALDHYTNPPNVKVKGREFEAGCPKEQKCGKTFNNQYFWVVQKLISYRQASGLICDQPFDDSIKIDGAREVWLQTCKNEQKKLFQLPQFLDPNHRDNFRL